MIDDFLKETKYCNFHNSEIFKFAHQITSKYSTPQNKAVALFYWVRDNILYRVGNWHKTASETLAEREGTCTNSANLLVAFLRAIKIPSGYGVLRVHGQRYFGPIALRMLHKFFGKESTHIYPLVYLNGKWIKCDPSDDAQLSNSTYHMNYTTKIVHWDGEHDAILNLKKKNIFQERFPIVNIDSWMTKKPKHAKGIALKVANLYIRFLRENKRKVSTTKDLEIFFRQWLKSNHSFDYYYFLIASKLRDFELRKKKNEKNS